MQSIPGCHDDDVNGSRPQRERTSTRPAGWPVATLGAESLWVDSRAGEQAPGRRPGAAQPRYGGLPAGSEGQARARWVRTVAGRDTGCPDVEPVHLEPSPGRHHPSLPRPRPPEGTRRPSPDRTRAATGLVVRLEPDERATSMGHAPHGCPDDVVQAHPTGTLPSPAAISFRAGLMSAQESCRRLPTPMVLPPGPGIRTPPLERSRYQGTTELLAGAGAPVTKSSPI
jgi:hypothetical protein